MKIYFDGDLVQGSPVPMLLPFWPCSSWEKPESDPLHGRFRKHLQSGPESFEVTSLKKCDLAVLPFDYGHVLQGKRSRSEVIDAVKIANRQGKKTLIFCWHDSSEPLNLPSDALVYRTALDRSRRGASEFCMPTFSEDFVEKYFANELPTRNWAVVPTVSFCGRVSPELSPQMKTRAFFRNLKARITRPARKYPYGKVRLKALKLLERSPSISTRFVVYSSFWGGLGDAALSANVDKRVLSRQTYVNNLCSGDYNLCIRGAGNFSMRLYETLCLGRIPIILDTDSVFPFDELVDWSRLGILVPEKLLSHLPSIICDFHMSLNEERFRSLQIKCREFWQNSLSPHGFFTSDLFVTQLKTALKQPSQ